MSIPESLCSGGHSEVTGLPNFCGITSIPADWLDPRANGLTRVRVMLKKIVDGQADQFDFHQVNYSTGNTILLSTRCYCCIDCCNDCIVYSNS